MMFKHLLSVVALQTNAGANRHVIQILFAGNLDSA